MAMAMAMAMAMSSCYSSVSPPINPNSILPSSRTWSFAPLQRSRRSRPRFASVDPSSASSSSDGDKGGGGSSIHLKSAENAVNMQELHRMDKEDITNTNDVRKLFNDIQQNMLFLNEQRVAAIDNLHRVEREKEILIARANILEAEIEAGAIEREVSERNLLLLKSKANKNKGYANRRGHYFSAMMESIPIFSDMLVRLDSMVLTGAINTGQANSLKVLALKRDIQTAEKFSLSRIKSDSELASDLLPLLEPNRRYGMHITHICTELSPITECGTLGGFVLDLSKAMQRRGNLIDVILPKYSTLKLDEVQNLREVEVDFYSYYNEQWHKNKILAGVVHGVGITFIEPLHPDGFFQRDHVYGYNDDFERFSYFCRAALDYILKSGKRPDILHLHNWQTAIVAPLFWDIFAGQGLGRTRILLTCNDLKNQCLEEPRKLSLCGLDPWSLHKPDRFQDSINTKLVNILKGGIVYANKVTIPFVSQNIKSGNHGQSLDSTLALHKLKVLYIRNGLNQFWDPSSDQYLPSSYSYEDLSGKLACKSYLKQKLGLNASDSSVPLIGCIALVIGESELELIKAASECAKSKGSQFVFVGESKVQSMQKTMEELREKDVRAFCKYEESLVHLVLAASDIFVNVSIHDDEITFAAMRYGAVPVTVKESDQNNGIIDVNSISLSREANAFTSKLSSYGLSLVLSSAIDCKVNNPQRWNEIMRNGMLKDFSWDGQCADEYMAAYESIKQL